MSSLSLPHRLKPLDTFEQLARSIGSYDIRVYPGTYLDHFFHSSSDPILREIGRKMDSQKTMHFEPTFLHELEIMYNPAMVTFQDVYSFEFKRLFVYNDPFGKSLQ